MQTSGILVAALLAADAGLAAALPFLSSESTSTAGRASLPAKRNPSYTPSGPLALAKAHLKFGAAVPNDTANAVARINAARIAARGKRSTGSATNTPTSYDSEYLTPVSIGTPAQDFNLDFDTGSSDLWVFSTELPSSEVDGQTQYNPSSSTSAKQISGAKWSISYGDGSSSSGNVYTDKVTVGGLTVSAQAVEPAETVSSSFTSDSASDGLLGLAFSSLNTVSPTQQKTFFDSAKSSLTSQLFTADLQHDANGTYNFGFIDTSAYTGDIAYTDVNNSSGFWGFSATGYAVGSGSSTTSTITGIADTGTTLMLMPDAVVTAYYKEVSGASYSSTEGGYVFSCSASLPNFAFTVGNGTITVPGTYINYAPVDSTGSTCYGGIQSDSSIGFAIFGDVALKSAFVVFDGANNQLGWASKSTATSAAASSSSSSSTSDNAAAAGTTTTSSAAAATTTSKHHKGSKSDQAAEAEQAAAAFFGFAQ